MWACFPLQSGVWGHGHMGHVNSGLGSGVSINSLQGGVKEHSPHSTRAGCLSLHSQGSSTGQLLHLSQGSTTFPPKAAALRLQGKCP